MTMDECKLLSPRFPAEPFPAFPQAVTQASLQIAVKVLSDFTQRLSKEKKNNI